MLYFVVPREFGYRFHFQTYFNISSVRETQYQCQFGNQNFDNVCPLPPFTFIAFPTPMSMFCLCLLAININNTIETTKLYSLKQKKASFPSFRYVKSQVQFHHTLSNLLLQKSQYFTLYSTYSTKTVKSWVKLC